MDTQDLKLPELYINRDLSLLEFNQRVLEQARDINTPLLERLCFLCISSTNLDEFFEVRVAGLLQKEESCSAQAGADNIKPHELLNAINDRARALVDDQYDVFNTILIPALASHGIHFLRRDVWSAQQVKWLHDYFREQLLPILTPMGLDPAHPFPRILNKSLNFIVALEGKNDYGPDKRIAIVQVPRALPDLIQLPDCYTDNDSNALVFLSSLIHAFVGELFHGMQITGCYQFRVTRNSHLFVDEEEIDDLLRAVEGELASRRYGDAVRLEISAQCPVELTDYLLKKFEIGRREMYRTNGPVNLNRLHDLYDLVDRPDLKYPAFIPALPDELKPGADIFDVLKRQDILLHHPFQSFSPVTGFVRGAAADPDVLSIKQTLYRTGTKSDIIDALVSAARDGKEVTVVVELRARFDEEANIGLANTLQEAGVHVVYGIVGYKTHAKMIHVVRREGNILQQYVHLGTGNYHAHTARLYTDYGLLTADRAVCNDVHDVFLQLTSLCEVAEHKKIWQSPHTLQASLIGKIEHETGNACNGLKARIIVKVNAITEPELVRALYRASMAGVQVDLIVRGICSLRPGVPGVSDNIRVRSVIGRFLEHTRVYCFENAGEPEVYAASADWMERNLFHRVEICFPITVEKLRNRIINELEVYLQDNSQAWLLQRDGKHRRADPGDAGPVGAQSVIAEIFRKNIILPDS